MRYLIAADMEGITGVVTWNQVTTGNSDYERFRKVMTGEVNAAIKGLMKDPLNDIVVTDGHGFGTNILPEELDQRVRLNSGYNTPLGMVQGVDNQVNAAVFIGYHARMGTPNSVLDHTYSLNIANVWLNEKLVGEIGLNAALCGYYNVPVLMLSGDAMACSEARKWIPGILTVEVKRSSGRTSSESLSLESARQMIQQTCEYALQRYKNDPASAYIVKVEAPVRISIEFSNSTLAEQAALLPGVARVGRRIDLAAEDMRTAYQTFRACIRLAKSDL